MQRGQAVVGYVLALVGAVFLIGFLWWLLGAILGYWFEPVGGSQVGVQFQGNKPVNVVGPGVYTDLSPFADIKRVDTRELAFTVTDDEVLTKDLQRISVNIAGTVRRPGLDGAPTILGDWSRLSTFFTDDVSVVGNDKTDGVVQRQGRQAIKVCVGDLDFSKAVVGSARDVLRECITKELADLMSGYGLIVNPSNLVVPNVGLGVAVQKAMDDITNARFQEQVARQNETTARAQADQNLATEQGKIRVEQGRIQEQARQDATTAVLDQQKLEAQRAVIEQQKANEQFTAEKNIDIARANAESARINAMAATASQAAVAAIYQGNPEYAKYENTKSIAGAWHEADKVIVPAGTDPNVIIGGTQPVVQTPAR